MKANMVSEFFKGSAGVFKLVIISVLFMTAYSVTFTPIVNANGGGVGGGGSGTGATGGHHTRNGHGWVIYGLESGGPTDGFRNGAAWSTAYNTCKSANTTQVYAYIIQEPDGSGRIYDYKSTNEGYRGQFVPPGSADLGKAATISTSTAKSAYDAISKSPYNVNTSGYTFGSNVGWFCYAYKAPTTTPPTWTLSSNSKVSATTAKKGDTVSFTHHFQNDGPDHARNWVYETRYRNLDASNNVIDSGVISSLSNTSGTANLAKGDFRDKVSKFVIPSYWTAGYKRCETLYINSYRSPNPASSTTTEVCVTVTTAGAPVVSLNCSVSGGTYTLSGNAKDPDRAGPLTLQFSKNGTTINTGVTSTGSTGNFSVNVTTFMGSPPSTTTFTVTAKGINNAGALAPPDASDTDTCNVAPVTTGGGSFCPGDEKISNNTHVEVDLPDQTPSGKSSAPTGYTTNQYDTYTQYVSKNNTTVTSINDISSGGSRISISKVSGSESYQKVKLEYKSYVDGMPYDPNQASVSYTSEYDRTDWYAVYSHNQCDGRSATLDGSKCKYNYSAPSYPACSGAEYYYSYTYEICMDYLDSADCPTGTYLSSGKCYKNTDGTYQSDATCSEGTRYGSSCYNTKASYTQYYCNDPSETRTGSTCYGSYNATAYYKWTNNGTYSATTPNTVNAYAMNACFDRNFQVRDVTISTSYDDPEDPSAANTTSASTTVDFIVPPGFPPAPNGLRTSVKVNLNYTVTAPCPVSSGSVTVNGGNLPSSGSAPLNDSNCPVSSPPLQAGDTVCMTYVVSPGQGRVKIDGTPVGASGSVSGDDCTNPLVNAPYVHILGQDAFAGGRFADGMNDQCSSGGMSGGSLRANYKTTGPQTRGSGSQYAAMARGVISGFASGTLKTSTPTAEKGLTFANSGTTGNLGAQHCVPDYFSTRPASVAALPDGNLNQFNGAGRTAAYSYNGNLTLTRPGSGGGAGIQKGNRIAIYVNGDVFINKNIEFKKDGWVSEEDIPSFYVIAKGDIYISPNVTVLDGVYVAQPNGGSGGTINTCAPGFGRYSASSLYENCKDNKLMVNGAFVAQTINFLRTFSSLRTSLGGERPISTDNSGPCDGNVRTGSRPSSDTNHDCAAEIINFSPETYLSEPSMLPVGGPAMGKYDYITSLSPVL